MWQQQRILWERKDVPWARRCIWGGGHGWSSFFRAIRPLAPRDPFSYPTPYLRSFSLECYLSHTDQAISPLCPWHCPQRGTREEGSHKRLLHPLANLKFTIHYWQTRGESGEMCPSKTFLSLSFHASSLVGSTHRGHLRSGALIWINYSHSQTWQWSGWERGPLYPAILFKCLN